MTTFQDHAPTPVNSFSFSPSSKGFVFTSSTDPDLDCFRAGLDARGNMDELTEIPFHYTDLPEDCVHFSSMDAALDAHDEYFGICRSEFS